IECGRHRYFVGRPVPSVGSYGINVERRHTLLVPIIWSTLCFLAVEFLNLLIRCFPLLAAGLAVPSALEELSQAPIHVGPHSSAHRARFLFVHVIAAASFYFLNCDAVPIDDLSPKIE